jgi:peptide/nickel transport system substrate-binding protein
VLRLFFCTALACLAGCSPQGDRPAATPLAERQGAPAPGITLAVSNPHPRSDGIALDQAVAGVVRLLTTERLVAVGREGRPQARIAERWEVSPDGLTWRFTLRKGLTFQDGEPITAAAVRRAIEPSDPDDTGYVIPGLRDIAAVESSSPHEVVVRLRRPNAFLLDSLNLAPIAGTSGSPAGPFRLDQQASDRVILGRFKGYYRGRPALESITVVRYPSQREAWSALLRDEVDGLYDLAPEALEFAEDSPQTQVTSFLRPFVTALVFNVAHPQLGRRDVRRALNVAVDRQRIIDAVIGGRGIPATDHLWPNHWARDDAAPAFGFDAPAAKAALDAAGLRPAARKGPPIRFSFTCVVPADPRYERLALLIQRQLLSIDVDMRLRPVPLDEFRRHVLSGEFDAFLAEVVAGFGLDLIYANWHSSPPGPYFRTGYTGADAVLDRVRQARTDGDTRAAVHALQKTMFDDPPAVFIHWAYASRALSRRVVVPADDGNDVIRSVDVWRRVDGPASGAGATTP